MFVTLFGGGCCCCHCLSWRSGSAVKSLVCLRVRRFSRIWRFIVYLYSKTMRWQCAMAHGKWVSDWWCVRWMAQRKMSMNVMRNLTLFSRLFVCRRELTELAQQMYSIRSKLAQCDCAHVANESLGALIRWDWHISAIRVLFIYFGDFLDNSFHSLSIASSSTYFNDSPSGTNASIILVSCSDFRNLCRRNAFKLKYFAIHWSGFEYACNLHAVTTG